MKKKFYIQPQTIRESVALVNNIALTSTTIDNNPTGDMRDPAPARTVQGLKYLI